MNPDDLNRYPQGLRALVASLPEADARRLLQRYDQYQRHPTPVRANTSDWYTPGQEARLAQSFFNCDPGDLAAFNPYRRS